MTAPSDAAIRKYIDQALALPEYGGQAEEGVDLATAAVSDLWNVDDLRPSEKEAMDRIIREHTECASRLVLAQLRVSMVDAALEIARECPDAPRMEWAE